MNYVSTNSFPYWNRYTQSLLTLTIAAIAATGCAQRQPATPAPTAKISTSQKLGVRLVQDLIKDPKINKNSNISVGTFKKTIILNGRVASAAQKNRIGQMAKKKAAGYRVINQLVVLAPTKNTNKPQKS